LQARATLIGLVAAILLIAALIFGTLGVIVPKNAFVTAAGTVASIVGFVLVIVAASVVIAEGSIVRRQLEDELRDIPDLANTYSGVQERISVTSGRKECPKLSRRCSPKRSSAWPQKAMDMICGVVTRRPSAEPPSFRLLS
jgi:uncharacterized membrane protein